MNISFVIKVVYFILFMVTYVVPTYATQITIVNLDGADEGFFDNTAVSPVGGNTGTTIGEQRLQVFQYAASIWETIIDSDVEIRVEAKFDPLTCTSTSAVLGSAGTATIFKNFPNSPISNTWYPVALANSLAGYDLTSLPDIRTTFNSSIDNNDNCLYNKNWYYGLDGNKPFNSTDLLVVVMHEIAHGLGFQTFVDMTTGEKFGTPARNDVFMLNLEDHSLGENWSQLTDAERLASATDNTDLHWIGSAVTSMTEDYSSGVNQNHIQQYAPTSVSLGSSVSHFDTALTPNELMEPIINEFLDGPGLTIQLLQDIGWGVFTSFLPVIGGISDVDMSGASTQTQFSVRDEDTALSSLTFSFDSSNTSLIDSSGFVVSGTSNLQTLSISPKVGAVGTSIITVNVSDDVNTVSESFQLTVTNSNPVITISTPIDGASYMLVDEVIFGATASDTEDGIISSNVQWISSIDGALGAGEFVNAVLSEGVHIINASITDSGGISSNSNISVTIYGDSDGDQMNDLWELTSFGTLVRDGTGDFDNDGIVDLDEYLISIAVADGDLNNDGLVNIVDVLIAHQILRGDVTLTALQLAHGDVAPLISGIPAPDGQFNIGDVLVITRKATGLVEY